MTSPSDPTPTPDPSDSPSNSNNQGRSPRPKWLKYGLYGAALGTTAIVAGGAGFGWYWVHYQLPGFVSETLSDLLLRPVEVGPVESVGLTEIRMGKSVVLPRPEDPDSAEAQEVIARWNLWEILNPVNLLGDRIIPLHLEFRDATVYVEQGDDGSLVDLTLAESEDEGPGPVEIQVASVKAYNTDVKVIPAAFDRFENSAGVVEVNEPVVPLQILGAEASVDLQNWQDGAPQKILFNTTATLDVAGSSSPVAARGEFRGDLQRIKASARGTDLSLDGIAQLAPGPIWVRSGVASGNVSVDYAIDGAWPTLQGTAQVKDLQVDGELLPRSLRVNEGAFRFGEQEVDIDTLRVRYGEVSAQVKGKVDLANSRLSLTDPQGSELDTAFDLTVNAPDVGLGELQDTFGLELPIALEGLVGAEANLTGTIDNPVLTGRVNTLGPFQVDQVEIDTLEAEFSVRSRQAKSQRAKSQQAKAEDLNANTAESLMAQAGGGSVNRRLDKLPERLAAIFPVEATLEDLRIVPASGGEITGDAMVLLRDRNQLESMEIADVQSSLQLRSLNLNNLARVYGAPTTVGLGLLSGQLSATGPLEDWQAQGQLSALGGEVSIIGGGSDTEFAGRVNWAGIGTQRFASLLPEEVRRQVKGDLAGQAQITGELGEVPVLSAAVRTGWGGGAITANGTLRGERWQGAAQVQNAQLVTLLPRYGGILSANAEASGDLSGDLNRIRATVSSRLTRFAGGNVNAAVNLAGGQWQANVQTQNIQLARLAPQGTGRWTGVVTAAGPVDALTALDLTPVRAQVNGSLLPGEPGTLLTRPQQDYLNRRLPVAVAARWDGSGVAVDRVQGPGLSATGRVDAAFKGGNLALGPVDFVVDVEDVDLEVLPSLSPVPLPDVVDQIQAERDLLAGNAAFQGRIYGPIESLALAGDVRLDGLAVLESPFEDSLVGTVSGGLTRGLVADLQGERDRIFVTLNSNFLPTKFEVNWDGAIATGRLKSAETLEFFVSDLPLERFPLPASLTAGFGTPRGIATAKGTFRLRDGQAQAQFGVDNPGLQTVWGDRAAGNIAYSGFRTNKIAIWDTQLRRGDGVYGLRADLVLQDDPKFDGELQVNDGRLEQVLRILRLTDFDALSVWAATLRPPNPGRASDLGLLGINTSEFTVLDQLYKLNEIQALLAQEVQRDCRALPVPPLSQVTGEFDGAIAFSGTVATGANANFNISGNNWQWPTQADCRGDQIDLTIDRATLAGTLNDGTLNLEPAEFQTGETIARYVGLIGQEPNGKFELENFPAELLRRVPQIRQLYAEAPLPLLSGTLNIDASLAGTLGNPNARGQIELLDGRLNQLPVQSATGSFNYSAARLNFGSRVLVQGKGDDPIRISGGLPLPLPISTVQPDSDAIRFKASVTNEEFGLISLIAPQFQWLGGEGRADVEVAGTLSQPIANGELVLNDAEVAISELPEPLKGISGTAQLEGDRLIVNNIQGNLTEGQIRIDGALPLFPLPNSAPPITKPITVDLDQLRLTLRDLYQGGVNGQIVVNGSAIAPEIGGKIGLVGGRVVLPTDPTALNAGGGAASAAGGDIPVSFNDLEISLGKGLQIVQRPLLNFLARGGLTLDGRLADLKPSGRIEVRRGQVNLFATQFFLERGEPQFVEFRPEDGLDPYLDVNLIANVVESSNNPFTTDNTAADSTEIRENFVDRAGVGQTVRVRASVEGNASEILNNLALTSRPARSEGQILALIGGSLANSVGDESSGTVAIANLAGASLLNTIQSNIANTLGLTDFRVYPTVVSSRPDNDDDDEEDVETSVGLALELGLDITNRLSASVAQVFSTADTTTRLNLNYRLNENTLIRGSTDFTGENRFSIQFEKRF
ncbi:MAG: translocation/assembly module TamB domain-containing protein [Cyanophyceae cyanobacterium]